MEKAEKQETKTAHTLGPYAALGGHSIDTMKRRDNSRDDMMDYRSLVSCEAPFDGNEFDNDSETDTQIVATAYGRTGEEAAANASLFAAAPDLLTIAKRWNAIKGGAWHVERQARDIAELEADTAAVIAKVEAVSQ